MVTNTLEPAFAFHPWEMIAEELEARWWTQQDFATIISKPQGKLNDIIKWKASITPEWAILIWKAFGTSPNVRLGIQQEYDLWNAKKTFLKNDRLLNVELLSKIKSLFPVRELVKFWFIEKTWQTATELKEIVLKFLDIENIEDKVFSQKQAFFRKANKDNTNENSMNVWLRIIENRAKKNKINTYDEKWLEAILKNINQYILNEKTGIDDFVSKLNEVGVLVAFARHFEKTGVDGVSFWIENNKQKNPVIWMSLRHNRYDNFWFTLLHELGHIVKKHNQEWYIYDDENSIKDSFDWEGKEKEKEANERAKRVLIPQDLENKLPRLREISAILNFCTSNAIHHSIVLWRLKNDWYVAWSRYNNYHILPVKDRLNLPKEFLV